MYHSSTVYERATNFLNGRGSPRHDEVPHSRAAARGRREEQALDASGQRGDRAERGPAAARPTPGQRSAPERSDPGEDSWPFGRPRYVFPPAGRAVRDAKQEQRIAEHIQRHKERGARPPRDRGLSRDEIVRTAIAVADAEGPEAISMRRIARELRAGPMSLYWYVSSKEELLDLMLESLEAEVEAPEPTGDWRADLRVFANQMRAVLNRHPWALEFIGSRPPTGPNDARNLERLLGILAGLGLDPRPTMDLLGTIATYVLGAVIQEGREIRTHREQEKAEAGRTSEELDAERERYRDWFRASGQYPQIARLIESGIDPDDPATRDERFEFGLDVLLNGIAAQVHASPPPPPAQPLPPQPPPARPGPGRAAPAAP
jgi:AcrR family transcriptional regulator